MAKEKVDIPVLVTGLEQARKELAELRKRVEELEPAGKKGAAGTEEAGKKTEELGKKTGKAGDQLFDFEKKGEKVVKQFIGVLNPQLAQAADFMIDLAEGATKVTGTLMGVAAAGVAMGAVVAVFSRLHAMAGEATKAAQRYQKALEDLRAAQVGERAGLAEQAAKAGVFADPVSLQRALDAAKKGREGLPEELAENAAVAILRAGITDEQEITDLVEGIVVEGLKPVEFAGSEAADRKAIAQKIAAGRRPEAAGATERFLLGRLPSRVVEGIEAAVRRVRETTPATEDELRTIRNFLIDAPDDVVEAGERALGERRFFGGDVLQQTVGNLTLQEILDIVERERDAISQRQERTRAVMGEAINVRVESKTFVDTQNNFSPRTVGTVDASPAFDLPN